MSRGISVAAMRRLRPLFLAAAFTACPGYGAKEEAKEPFVLVVVQWMSGGEAKIQTTEFASQESCEAGKEFIVQSLEAMAAKREKATQIGYAVKCNRK